MDLPILAMLFTASILGGAVNAVAGGGTFFTFPALIWAGLPPLIANTTNMVALVPANFAALPALRPQLAALGRTMIKPVLVGLVGGVVGAYLLLHLGNDIFADAVPWLMGTATLLFAVAPSLRRYVANITTSTDEPRWPMGLLFVFAIYGGYFGAGLGQITLAALILAGYDNIHEANALKNLVAGMIGLVAAVIFVATGTINWSYALIMIAGAIAGGYAGGVLSKLVAPALLRAIIICLGVALTISYFLRAL